MNAALKPIIKDIKKRYKVKQYDFSSNLSVLVTADQIVGLCTTLRDKHKFEMLSSLTAVDYWPQEEPRFHIVYQFNSYSQKMRLEVRVPLDGNNPTIDSITSVYPNANWHEREIWDLFGINFKDHPDLRRILMPFEWEGHPLRKDYPLGYEEVQFTFNFDEILKKKPRPKD